MNAKKKKDKGAETQKDQVSVPRGSVCVGPDKIKAAETEPLPDAVTAKSNKRKSN